MEKGKKVTRQYRIAEPIDRELNEISNATGKTKNRDYRRSFITIL